MANLKTNKTIFVLKHKTTIKIINIFWKWLSGLCEGLNQLWDVHLPVYDIKREYIQNVNTWVPVITRIYSLH